MAVKRRPTMMVVKEKKLQIKVKKDIEQSPKTKIDRLTGLPECLRLHILSKLDSKYSVQTSVLSKSWVSSWKAVGALRFNSSSFGGPLLVDQFLQNFLQLRDHSVKLETLIFKCGRCCSHPKTLNTIVCYALSHGVKNVDAYIKFTRSDTRPIFRHNTISESLVSVNLQSERLVILTSGSFENLLDLDLNQTRITDPRLFSRFPALKKLRLIHCCLDERKVGKTLKIRAHQLTDLTIITSIKRPIESYQLTTPELRFFEYGGFDFPSFEAHGVGLPVLEIAVIDFYGYRISAMKVRAKLDGLLSLFAAIRSVKLLTLFASVLYFLSTFLDNLKRNQSPFCNLDYLIFDLGNVDCLSAYYEGDEWWLKASQGYLIQNSPNVKFDIINPIRPVGLKWLTF